jgi:hypothetical protein
MTFQAILLTASKNLIFILYRYLQNEFSYEEESVNGSKMDIKRKTCDIRTWGKMFLDISSTNIDTLVPPLYQCAETRSTEVF